MHEARNLEELEERGAVRIRYDRGTLQLAGGLLRPARPGDLDIVWDERSGVFRAPPWRYREVAAALRSGGTEVVDDVPAFGVVNQDAWNGVDLRPYQRAALCAWEASGRRGLLVLPTGSGKTRVAIAAMASVGVPTLCLVPTRVLLHQWRAELAKFYRGSIGVWGDGERGMEPITVITFESAYRNMARLGNRYQLLVVDEAHHFGTGARDEALEMAVAPYRLGLTATPPSSPAALGEIARLVGPTVFRSSVNDLAGTYLADFECVVLHIPLESDEREEYDAARGVFRPFYAAFRRIAPRSAWKDFVAMANETPEGRAALSAWRHSREIIAFTRGKAATLDALLREHRDNRTLIFTSNNSTAYSIARRNLVMPLTCDIKRKERDEVLERFRRGEIRALVSSQVLNEGIDVPDADVAVIVGGTQGEREHVQRVGRLLRPREGKRAIIYELIADGTTETRQAQRRRLGLD